MFTRTLDITERVPEIVAMALTLKASCTVIDGEAVAPGPTGGRSFRSPARIDPRHRRAARGAARPARGVPVPLTAFLFDVHVDGRDLIDRPGSERFERLAAIVHTSAR